MLSLSTFESHLYFWKFLSFSLLPLFLYSQVAKETTWMKESSSNQQTIEVTWGKSKPWDALVGFSPLCVASIYHISSLEKFLPNFLLNNHLFPHGFLVELSIKLSCFSLAKGSISDPNKTNSVLTLETLNIEVQWCQYEKGMGADIL